MPYAPCSKELNFNSGTKAKAPKAKIEGQSIAMNSHKIKTPIKMPNTCMPEVDNPLKAGKYLNKNIDANAIMIIK